MSTTNNYVPLERDVGKTKNFYSTSIFTHPYSFVKEKLTVPTLPDLARSILKNAIVSMVNAGLITGANAEQLISLLQLRDA